MAREATAMHAMYQWCKMGVHIRMPYRHLHRVQKAIKNRIMITTAMRIPPQKSSRATGDPREYSRDGIDMSSLKVLFVPVSHLYQPSASLCDKDGVDADGRFPGSQSLSCSDQRLSISCLYVNARLNHQSLD
jgi:hypothetical protein